MRLKALERRVVHGLMLRRRANGPARLWIPHAHIGIGALGKTALARVHAKHARRVLAHQAAEVLGAQLSLKARGNRDGTMLHAGPAVGNRAEVVAPAVLLPVQVKAAVVGRNRIDLAGHKRLAQGCTVTRMAQRRTHHILGTRKAVLALLQITGVVEHQILGAGLDIDILLPARFGSTDGLEPQLGRKVHHVDRSVPGQVRQIQQAAHGLTLARVRTAERMPLGSMNPLLVHALLKFIHQRAVLAMHAQDTAQVLELLQHLECLGIVQAQVVVGKVGLKRRNARLAHSREIGAVALIPLGECHMKSVVCRAGAVGAMMPLGKGIGHGHAAIGRRVVHDGRRTAAGSRTRTGLKAIGRPIHASPALHVRVAVDKAGKHPAARGILDGIALARLDCRGNPHNLIALHGKIGAAKPLGRHERAVFDDDHNCSSLIDAVGHAIKI